LEKLSLSLLVGRGRASHHPDPLQVAPKASWVGQYLEFRARLLAKLVMRRALQNQELCHFFCTAAVVTYSGVLTPNTMEVRRQ